MTGIFGSLLGFLLLAQTVESSTEVKKCCKRNQILDFESLTCRDRDVSKSDISLLPPKMLNESATNSNKTITRTTLRETDLAVGSVQCSGQLRKVLELPDENSGYFISTTTGRLVSSAGQFELSLQIGDFCIDLAQKVYKVLSQ